MDTAKAAIPSTATASPPPTQYIYKPLTEPAQIRTLVLHPTTSRIECSIRHATHQSGDYQALSYVWGSEHRPFKAVVVDMDGNEQGYIPLTNNLRDALCDLRDAKELESKIFWIDQICIYSDRTAMKHLGNLRFMPQFSEGFDFVSERKK